MFIHRKQLKIKTISKKYNYSDTPYKNNTRLHFYKAAKGAIGIITECNYTRRKADWSEKS